MERREEGQGRVCGSGNFKIIPSQVQGAGLGAVWVSSTQIEFFVRRTGGPGGQARLPTHQALSRQRFTSKQDVIRHYNMHKKRDNSLQHGFMRFSPLDDCSVYYHGCHLNGKSTHYHCMQVPAAALHPTLPQRLACPGRGTSLSPFLGLAGQRRGSPGLRLGQCPVGRGGDFPMAILGAGAIQRAVYTDRHFSGFNTKSSIANGS